MKCLPRVYRPGMQGLAAIDRVPPQHSTKAGAGQVVLALGYTVEAQEMLQNLTFKRFFCQSAEHRLSAHPPVCFSRDVTTYSSFLPLCISQHFPR